jgi:hypothetical protein
VALVSFHISGLLLSLAGIFMSKTQERRVQAPFPVQESALYFSHFVPSEGNLCFLQGKAAQKGIQKDPKSCKEGNKRHVTTLLPACFGADIECLRALCMGASITAYQKVWTLF